MGDKAAQASPNQGCGRNPAWRPCTCFEAMRPNLERAFPFPAQARYSIMASLFSERLAPAWSNKTSFMSVGSNDDSPLPLPGLRHSAVGEQDHDNKSLRGRYVSCLLPGLAEKSRKADEWKRQIGSYINSLPSDSWRVHKLTRRSRRMISTDTYCFSCLRRRDEMYCGTMLQRFGESFGEPQPCRSYFWQRRLQELSIPLTTAPLMT